LDEKELLDRIKEDPSEFAVIFREYYPVIFGYVFRRVTDFDITRDVVSETFRKAFINIKYFDYRGISVKVWLYRIATNETNLYFRHKRREINHIQKLDISPPESLYQQYIKEDRIGLDLELARHEQFARIATELKSLPVKYQEVLSLRYFEGKQNRDIAMILGKKEGTVKSLISRGLSMLKEKCNDWL
jgi:RNA polymerase sigma-70 factor (ECF subfamily)